MSDRPCRIAYHSDTGSDIACNDCAGADDGTVPQGHARQKDRTATYPYFLTDGHRQRSLQAAAPLVEPAGMVGAVDLHCRSQHRPPSDPDGCRVEDNAARVYVHAIAKREVPAVGDVKGSFKENPFPDSGEKCCKLGRTGTTQRGVHGQ